MNKKDYYENDTCPFADNCTSKGLKCMTCNHRYKKKRNYLDPYPHRPRWEKDPYRTMPIICRKRC